MDLPVSELAVYWILFTSWSKRCLLFLFSLKHKMADTVGWNLADIKAGLVDTPRHVSEHLQWITEEGMLGHL